MGLFDKVTSKLFEMEPIMDSGNMPLVGELPELSDVDLLDVQLDNVNTDTIVEDIYVGNGLEDLTSSIFKVENVINSLPKEMPTATKQSTAAQLLESFGLTIETVCRDGQTRLGVLEVAKEKLNFDSAAVIQSKEDTIEEYKEIIASLEREIADENNSINNSNTKISEEMERVQKLVEFIIPGGVS